MKKALIILALCALVGCKTQTIPTTINHDSVRVEYRLDSVYVFQHDSIFRDRWRSGDTVYVTLEKWQTRWKDKVVIQHDTTTITNEQTIVNEVKYIPAFYKWCTALFFILVVIIVGKVALKIYLKAQSGGLV